MSNKELKRATAWGSAIALGASLLVGLPAANAAAGDVVLAPTSGTRTGAFFTDEFSLTTSISSLVSATTTAYEIINVDQQPLYIAVVPTGSETTTRTAVDATASGGADKGTVVITGYNDKGAIVDLSGITALGGASAATTSRTIDIWNEGSTEDFGNETAERLGEFVFDFASYDVERLVIRSIQYVANANTLIVQPVAATTSNQTALLTKATSASTARVGVAEASDMALGDGDVEVKVRSWVEAEAVADYETVDALYASSAVTVTFYDPKGTSVIPRIEQFKSGSDLYLNEDNNSNQVVGASIQFSKPVNLDQVDVTEWEYAIKNAGGTVLKAKAALTAAERKIRSGFTRHDQGDRIYLALDKGAALTIADGSLRVDVNHEDNTSVVAQSVAFNFPIVTEEYQIQAATTDVGNNTQADSDDTGFTVRAGTKAFTYKAQIKSDDTTRDKTASVPVIAVVTAGSYTGGDTLTVSGLNGSLARNQVGIVSGFTNSDGEWSVTVTSSAGTDEATYSIEFFVLDAGSNDTKSDYVSTNKSGTNALYTVTYAAATAASITPSTSVASGENVTLTFTAKDSFGVATNKNGTKALSVELKASTAANLDVDAAVGADGTATFTFKNYLKAGESDVLTATLYTGTALSPTTVTTTAVSLYAGSAASAINVPATLTGNITYADFITGGSTTAKPGPTNSEDIELTGTVVDANGNGIPGATVVVAAKGFQFAKLNPGTTDSRSVDTITISTNAAGVFQVSMWAQIVNTTGHAVTITAGGKTATTTVKTYLPTGLNGNNLKFELMMPANVVKNTTYAVTAKLTDKWGNPVATRTTNALSIQGVGSVQINSTDSATVKQFGRDGTTTVFLRSVKDIAGPGSVTATLTATEYSAGAAAAAATLTIAEITTNVATTVWDETKFANSITANVEVLESASSIVGGGKVNVGSFNGKLVVYAQNLDGKRISWKVGGNWGKATAVGNTLNRFDRPTPRSGVTVTVQIYVDGVLQLTKSVVTR